MALPGVNSVIVPPASVVVVVVVVSETCAHANGAAAATAILNSSFFIFWLSFRFPDQMPLARKNGKDSGVIEISWRLESTAVYDRKRKILFC
jgi:hypothetical protein